MDDETWMKEVKVLSPSLRKMKVSNVALVFPILFYIYITPHIYSSKFSTDDLLFS